MKYPWVAISLSIVWFGSTYLILKSDAVDINFVLFTAIVGTIIIAFIGFRSPKIK